MTSHLGDSIAPKLKHNLRRKWIDLKLPTEQSPDDVTWGEVKYDSKTNGRKVYHTLVIPYTLMVASSGEIKDDTIKVSASPKESNVPQIVVWQPGHQPSEQVESQQFELITLSEALDSACSHIGTFLGISDAEIQSAKAIALSKASSEMAQRFVLGTSPQDASVVKPGFYLSERETGGKIRLKFDCSAATADEEPWSVVWTLSTDGNHTLSIGGPQVLSTDGVHTWNAGQPQALSTDRDTRITFSTNMNQVPDGAARR